MDLAAILANKKKGNPQVFFQTFIPHLERKWNVCETSRHGQCVGFNYFIRQINRDKFTLVAILQHPKAARLSDMSPCCMVKLPIHTAAALCSFYLWNNITHIDMVKEC